MMSDDYVDEKVWIFKKTALHGEGAVNTILYLGDCVDSVFSQLLL